MPPLSGIVVLKRLKSKNISTPVVIIIDVSFEKIVAIELLEKAESKKPFRDILEMYNMFFISKSG